MFSNYLSNYVKLIQINKMLNVYLFNLSPGVLIKTLCHMWGKLNLPTLLFRVGVISPNKYGFLDIPRQMVPLPPYYFEVIMVDGVVSLIVVMMNG